ncbi:DUF5702 domain-containing protein [Bacillus alkalicellulosilyticus]|uniref:DUF5702 domain-containing protein n=1 Tax=Alkalihalobacterium alkalicellulosilyticum TaxID=1912214 RepID=UPI000998270E|nr:DUF5702 domain-containing protein [Bacillus alkalicellulosilyticus]
MKKIIHKIRTDIKGSVSIFFILIVAAVFLFNAVLIDYARILAADKQTEYAIQSAVRSALASYDNDLREFGLFGVDESSVSDFENVLKMNLEPPEDSGFNFIDPKVESVDVDFSRALAHPEIIQHQILEEMKYKAPVEIVKEIMEKFTFVSSAMKETSVFIESVEAIKDDFESREEKLDTAKSKLLIAKQKVKDGLERTLDMPGQSSFPDVWDFDDIVNHYNKYKQDVPKEIQDLQKQLAILNQQEEPEDDDEKQELEDEKEEIEETIEELEQSLVDFKKNAEMIILYMVLSAEQALGELNEAKALVEQAEQLNQQMKTTINQNQNAAEQNYGQAISKSDPPPSGANGNDLQGAMDSIKENAGKIEEYVYDPAKDGYDYFGDYKQAINQAISQLEPIPLYLSMIYNNFDNQTKNSLQSAKSTLENNVSNALDAINLALAIEEGTADTQRKHFDPDLEYYNEEDAENAEDEKENAESMLEEELADLYNQISGDMAIYNELSTLFSQYNAFIEENNLEGHLDKLDLSGDASSSAKDAMRLIDTLFRNLGDLLITSRNELYMNEYILMNFNSAVPNNITNPNDYKFENREVEYILYGIEESGANYGAALTQLFAIRFALRFIDAFTRTEVRGAGHPVLVFVAALAYALKTSIKDVKDLASSDPVPLINETLTNPVFIRVVYRDYLRLFLFMNPSGDKRLMRVMSVIQYKSGVDLTTRMSYVNGSVTTSTRLLFIPEIANTLNIVGVLNGNVNGNRYEYQKEANFSY